MHRLAGKRRDLQQRKKIRRQRLVEQLEERRLLTAAQEVEPNDDTASANTLVVEESSIVPGLSRSYIEGNLSAGESDVFRFTALAGDELTIAADARNSSLDPEIVLRNSAGAQLDRDRDAGPGQNSLISRYQISSSGTYFVELIGDNVTTSGDYGLTVLSTRGLPLEYDPHDRNNQTFNAESLDFEIAGTSLTATSVGTINSATDQDLYHLGFLNAGTSISLVSRLPQWSNLEPLVELIDAAGNSLSDTDATDSAYAGNLAADGVVYARVSGLSGEGTDGQYAIDVQVNDQIAPVVRSIDRFPDAAVSSNELFSTFSVTLSESLDADSLLPAAFSLQEAGADQLLGTADDVPYSLTTTYNDSNYRIDFVITDGPLGNGEYRLTLAPSITDHVGNPLQGGSAFIKEFTIDAVPDGAVFEGRDNGGYDKATPLTFETDTSGTGWLRSQIGYGSNDPSGDQDWWSFTAEAGDFIDVWAQEKVGGDRPSIDLYRLRSDGNGTMYLTGDFRGGPGDTAYVSGYEATEDTTYFVRVTGTGGYDVRVNLNRGTPVETDSHFSNDSTGQADALPFTQHGNTRTATVAGTVMSIADEDIYQLGFLNAGTTVTLDASSLPDWSLLEPDVSVFRVDPTNSNNWLYVTDTDATEPVFSGNARHRFHTTALKCKRDTSVFEGSRYTQHDETLNWPDAEAFAISSRRTLGIDCFSRGTSVFQRDLRQRLLDWPQRCRRGRHIRVERWHRRSLTKTGINGSPASAANSSSRDYGFTCLGNDGGTWYVSSGSSTQSRLQPN
ncbi:MAG: pre-peptidase C-terminal domain-containing protein [Pirellulaceae bacterium]